MFDENVSVWLAGWWKDVQSGRLIQANWLALYEQHVQMLISLDGRLCWCFFDLRIWHSKFPICFSPVTAKLQLSCYIQKCGWADGVKVYIYTVQQSWLTMNSHDCAVFQNVIIIDVKAFVIYALKIKLVRNKRIFRLTPTKNRRQHIRQHHCSIQFCWHQICRQNMIILV